MQDFASDGFRSDNTKEKINQMLQQFNDCYSSNFTNLCAYEHKQKITLKFEWNCCVVCVRQVQFLKTKNSTYDASRCRFKIQKKTDCRPIAAFYLHGEISNR